MLTPLVRVNTVGANSLFVLKPQGQNHKNLKINGKTTISFKNRDINA
jgi:hypothetical protein